MDKFAQSEVNKKHDFFFFSLLWTVHVYLITLLYLLWRAQIDLVLVILCFFLARGTM